MESCRVALVSQTPKVSAQDLVAVAVALQKQIDQDLQRIWEVDGLVDSFPTIDAAIQAGHWPIVILEGLPPNESGLHEAHDEAGGFPFALVGYEEKLGWALTASHECLEMIVDPSLGRLISGPSPEDPSMQVEFLVEVCDPCQHFAYSIDGVPLSDFCTQRYYSDDQASPGVLYSCRGFLTAPRELLPGGYISWRDSDNSWTRMDRDDQGTFTTPVPQPDSGEGLRTALDRLTAHQSSAFVTRSQPIVGFDAMLLERRRQNSAEAARRKATVLKRQIAAIKKGRQAPRQNRTKP